MWLPYRRCKSIDFSHFGLKLGGYNNYYYINSDVAPLQSNHCTEVPLYYCVNVHLPVHPAEDKVDSVLLFNMIMEQN